MSLAGCQIIPIDLNFHLQKCLEIFDKNQLTKSNAKIVREVNPPCLMPIRVKVGNRCKDLIVLFAFFKFRFLCFHVKETCFLKTL